MQSAHAVTGRGNRRTGFTIPEVLAVMGVIALLIAVLLPALTSGKNTAQLADSMNRLRQVHNWMTIYSNENRDHIVPSRFDYTLSAASYPVKVRSDDSLTGTLWGDQRYKGTWTDILWTFSGEGTKQQVALHPNQGDFYMFDSPDTDVYERNPSYDRSPFRSAAANTRNANVSLGTTAPGPKPFGTGAQEAGLAGYFAANNFFDARPDAPAYHSTYPSLPQGRWYVNGQIKAPDRSMYVVDSFVGETIDPLPGPYLEDPAANTLEVDFRYNGMCLMMFLDGHSSPEGPWVDICDLEKNRRIRVRNLLRNDVLDCP